MNNNINANDLNNQEDPFIIKDEQNKQNLSQNKNINQNNEYSRQMQVHQSNNPHSV